MNLKLLPLIFISAGVFASDNFALPTFEEARAAAEKDQKPIFVIITAPGDVAAIDAQHWLSGQRVLGKDGEKFHFCIQPREKKSREPALKFLNAKGETICSAQVPDTRKALKILAERVLKSDGKPISIENMKPDDFISPAMKDPKAIPKALDAIQAFINREMTREEVAESCQLMTTAVMLLNLETVRTLLTEKILKAAGPSRAIADSLLDLADEALAHGQMELAKKCWKAAEDAAKDESPVLYRTALQMQGMMFPKEDSARDKWEKRRVVDLVVLVQDFPSYLRAISCWDENLFFPVLFEGSSARLFVQDFAPKKVIRLEPRNTVREKLAPLVGDPAESPNSIIKSLCEACGYREQLDQVDLDRGNLRRIIERQKIEIAGLVLLQSLSGETAGGIALAAGRFQGIEFIDAPKLDKKTATHSDQIQFKEASSFCNAIETASKKWFDPHSNSIRYITLAGNYPYRYTGPDDNMGFGTSYCLDDLLGRRKDSTRYSVVGRLTGDHEQSTYQAMCSLFVQPKDLFCFNTYGTNPASIWGFYNMDFAQPAFEKAMKVTHLHGGGANITSFRNAVMPANKFGMIFINSSGGAGDWSVGGGGGSADDFPIGSPLAIHVTHSGSAANPYDINTLAGRALCGGAFYYWGSTAEPFLSSFQPPRYYAPRIAAGVPFSAVFRRRPGQEFWQPWRLIALGDPQFCLRKTPATRVPYQPGLLESIGGTFVDPNDLKVSKEFLQIATRYTESKRVDNALAIENFEELTKALADTMKTNPAHNYLRRTLESASTLAKRAAKADEFANWLREMSGKPENSGVKSIIEEQQKKAQPATPK